MREFLYPRIASQNLGLMLGWAGRGAILAGLYGMIHDQISYLISPEYFTKLKFSQFWYADLGLGDRVFASSVGFLATWWVGFLSAWFLARRLIPGQPRRVAARQIACGFALIFAFALFGGLLGFACGLRYELFVDPAAWNQLLHQWQIRDCPAFLRVAFLHYGGYLGGLLGLIVALAVLRPQRAAEGPR